MKTSADILNEKQAILNFISESNDSNLISRLKEFIGSYRSSDELPKWQKDELDSRLQAYSENPSNVLDWEDVKAELLAR